MRQVATLHAPVNVALLRAVLDDAGPAAQVAIAGTGTTARLVITAPSEEPSGPPTAAAGG